MTVLVFADTRSNSPTSKLIHANNTIADPIFRHNGQNLSLMKDLEASEGFDNKAKGEDVCVLTHSNKICIITLAECHPVLKEKKTVISVDYQFDNVNRLCNRVSGKGKKGAQHLNADSRLCRITCDDKSQYFIPCGIRCQLLETNDNLKSSTAMLMEKPLSDGFIAIVLPKLKDYNGEMEKLLTKDEYMAKINETIT